MKEKEAQLSLKIYLQLWSGPFLMLGGALVAGTTLYFYLTGYFDTEFGNRAKHHAMTVLEDVQLSHPTAKQGFDYTWTFIFKLDGQELTFPAQFQAKPGEPIAVDYMEGASGKIYVVNVAPGEK